MPSHYLREERGKNEHLGQPASFALALGRTTKMIVLALELGKGGLLRNNSPNS